MTTLVNERAVGLRVSTTHYILLWFGAAISVAELMTGALLAPLGLQQGILAILLGHIIGAVILYPIGLMGVQMKISSATITRLSFGRFGSYIFSLANILQLIGWTAVMIIIGAEALNLISLALIGYQNYTLCCLLIGGLICVWVISNLTRLLKINAFIIILLFICSLLVAWIVFRRTDSISPVFATHSLSFGAAVELNVAMSLSWLPLIADYTRKLTDKPRLSVLGCVLGYVIGGSFMFVIGLGSALFVGSADITHILLSVGFGVVALFIAVFSTVTTAFLDVYSAGISAANLHKSINEKVASLIIGVISMLLAILLPMSQYENFLYFIGSIFAPLFAILMTDYFLLGKNKSIQERHFNLKNTLLWVIGFILYRFLLPYNTFLGITLPVMIIICSLCFVVDKVQLCRMALLSKRK